MFTDILKFTKEHEDKANKIVDLYLEVTLSNSYEGIICICGISGTGKSEIAWWVSRKLYKMGISSHKINLDRYYKTQVVEREQVREETDIIGHREMDWDKINEEINCFNHNDIRVLIFEGLYAGYINGITFFIDTDLEKAKKFRVERGKEREDTAWRKYVVKRENEEILRKKEDYLYIIK